jgi:hypothetical protein
MSNSQFGFYSKTAAKQFGSFLYKMEDGSEQEITSLSLDKLGSDYQFKDKNISVLFQNLYKDFSFHLLSREPINENHDLL